MKKPLRRDGQATGMEGVYLVAAELTKRGLIVSPTSRSAFGADLLVTAKNCLKAWSVQVKTYHGKTRHSWLLNLHSKEIRSSSHAYVLISLNRANARQSGLPEFYIVPSRFVARRMKLGAHPHILLKDVERFKGKWDGVFGTR